MLGRNLRSILAFKAEKAWDTRWLEALRNDI